MFVDEVRAVLARVLQAFVVFLACFGLAMPTVMAQDTDDSSVSVDDEDDAVEEVVVTGSRLKRDTYTSISPLQVISGQVQREIGLIDPGTILHESTATSGVQVDLTFGAFVVDNGPGSTTVDLRGLGASRTLFLLNGRRLAPSGVEGAPTSPDVNLIPGSLVQQYEVLLDGASSIYGSDAVAGVVNVILDQDFDGLELEAFTNIPAAGDSEGMRNTFSAKWGYNGDRGFIGFGAEYNEIERLTLADRSWSNRCEEHREITTEGEVRTEDLWYPAFRGMDLGGCRIGGLAGYITELGAPNLGSMMYQQGFTNTGIPNFSDYNAFGVIIDTTGDGQADVNFADRNINGNDLWVDVIPEIETSAFMSYGEYTFAGESNITPYFEVLWSRRQSDAQSFVAQLFPQVNPLNPFNICNPLGQGQDCGIANDTMYTDPAVVQSFIDFYGDTPENLGLLTGAVGPIWVQPVVHVQGDRNNNTTDVQQLRIVGGIRGDLPGLQFGSVEDWSWDLYVTHTDTDGESKWNGIRGDRLNLALGNYSPSGTPCDNGFGVPLADDTAPGCVPVNMFADSLYSGNGVLNNDFETTAERDYLFGTREFDTEIKQTVASYYMSGDIFNMPGGTALLGLGLEWRKDEIDSIPNETAAEGLFFGFSADQGAIGDKTTEEFFAEIELPFFAGNPGMEELTLNVSTRYTKDEYYDGAWTYSAKLAYRPVESLLLRATQGTSFRAPNLRENFLANQTGFRNVTDPCVIPDAAVDINGNYIPELDNRTPQVIQNCVLDPGVDPFSFVNNGIQTYSTEVRSGGSLDLQPETSDSFSGGFVWEQPFWSSFDLAFSATYYDIKIEDEILEPLAGFIVADCYNDPQFDSAFCSRISRDVDSTFLIIDEGFINRDVLRARGIDYNLRVDIPTQLGGRAVDFAMDFAFNKNIELSSRVLAEGGDEIDYFQGEFGSPQWQGRGTFRADVGNWRYTWSTRYVSSVANKDARDDFGNIFNDATVDTCLGEANGDVECRDVDFAENYFTHDLSVFYLGDTWTVGVGLRNAFDEAPPLVDGARVGSFNNNPRGRGYDIWGRTAFVNVVFNWQ